MLEANATWLVTGCSKGLGRAIAETLLEAGYRVAMTARDPDQLKDLSERYSDRALALRLDVTDSEQMRFAVSESKDKFGGIDVLVNNAGYGYIGGVEEGEDHEIRMSFETNFFGPLAMIQAVLPGMRERKRGHIVAISSIGGLTTFPNVGFYHAAKFATEGLCETLAQEVAPFHIGVTIVEPGGFRTDFRGASMRQSQVRLPEYAETLGKQRDALLAAHGAQKGDPRRAAAAILKAVTSDKPPLHLLLGADALELARKKIQALDADFGAWEAVTCSTDFK